MSPAGGALPPGGLTCSCVVPSWEFDGRATSWNRFPLGDCQRPHVLRRRGCQRATRVRCDATREDRCQGCGKRHNRRLKRLISSGFTGRPSGFFFGTLTAPGIDVLPWDDSACSHRPGVPCSGKRGCRVHSLDVARWNGHAPQAWSWFVTASRRELAGVDVQFWKCWRRRIVARCTVMRSCGPRACQRLGCVKRGTPLDCCRHVSGVGLSFLLGLPVEVGSNRVKVERGGVDGPGVRG